MGLAKRVIPTLLVRGGRLIKGRRFAADRVIGNALQAARTHAMRGVDELVIFSLDPTPQYELIDAVTKDCFTPVAFGGGIYDLDTAARLFRSGVDKLIVNGDLRLIDDIARRYGSQAVVACVNVDEATDAEQEAALAESAGAGEIIVQSVDRDGTLSGYDLELVEHVTALVGVPVVASGGCAGIADMAGAFTVGASGVAAGALFSFTSMTPRQASECLNTYGFEVRV